MRTFSRSDWDAAQAAWKSGEFSDEWKAVRHQAAMRGMIYPPEGTKWDSWEDDEPSQRAMLIRAIRESPTLLTVAVDRSRNWGEVVAYIIRRRDEWRDELNVRERDLDRRRLEEDGSRRGAMLSIRDIVARIVDS